MARPRTVDIDAEQVLVGVVRWHAEAVASARQWLAECEEAARLEPKSFWARRDLAAAQHSVRILDELGAPIDAAAILGRDLSKYERAVTHRLIRELIAAGKLVQTSPATVKPAEVGNE